MHPEQMMQLANLRREDALDAAELRRTPRRRRRGSRDGGTRPAGRRGGFLRLWLASGSSNLADGVLFAGLPVLATQVTDSPGLIAGVAVALLLPMALVALPAGVVADRFDRRGVLVLGNLVRVVGLGVVLAAVLAGELGIAAIYAVAAIAGGSEILVDTAAQTAVPGLVERQDLERANARLGGTQVVMNDAVGAPIGSFLAGMGAGWALGLPVVLFALAAVVLRRLPRAPRPSAVGTGPLRPGLQVELLNGVRYLADHAVLRRMALANGVSNLGSTAFFAVFVLVVIGPLDLPATAFGWFLSALAAGGVLGSLAAGRVLRAIGHAATVKLASATVVGALTVATFTRSPLVMALSVAALGTASLVWNIGTRVLRQTLVPDALHGRVTATMAFVALVAAPVGGLLGGLVAELASVRAAGGVAIAANVVALGLLAPVTTSALDGARQRARANVRTAGPDHAVVALRASDQADHAVDQREVGGQPVRR